MSNSGLYIYGIVKSSNNLDWKEHGLNNKEVLLINGGNFNALVHRCQEKPYIDENSEDIKQMILAHNKVLDKAMGDFCGVIPLHFNTIIKRKGSSARFNLKKWLEDDQERLERIWEKIKDKKEYGLRIYYEKDKLIQKVSENREIKKLEKEHQGKSRGLSYLLQTKVKSKTNELVQEKITQFKKKFADEVKKIADEVKVNVSRIAVEEKKDLLVSLSVLVKEKQIEKIKEYLEKNKVNDFSFHLAGPFAPYSFVDPQKSEISGTPKT